MLELNLWIRTNYQTQDALVGVKYHQKENQKNLASKKQLGKAI